MNSPSPPLRARPPRLMLAGGLSAAGLLTALPAHADAIVPFAAPTVLGQIILLPLIAALEGLIMVRLLQQPWRTAMRMMLEANLISTLIGIVLGWIPMLLALMAVDAGHRALGPGPLDWVYRPVLVPLLFALSWVSEWWWLRRRWITVDRHALNRPLLLANGASYLALWLYGWI